MPDPIFQKQHGIGHVKYRRMPNPRGAEALHDGYLQCLVEDVAWIA